MVNPRASSAPGRFGEAHRASQSQHTHTHIQDQAQEQHTRWRLKKARLFERLRWTCDWIRGQLEQHLPPQQSLLELAGPKRRSTNGGGTCAVSRGSAVCWSIAPLARPHSIWLACGGRTGRALEEARSLRHAHTITRCSANSDARARRVARLLALRDFVLSDLAKTPHRWPVRGRLKCTTACVSALFGRAARVCAPNLRG